MKIILAIFCGLMVLFAGGCALMLVFSGVSGSSGAIPLALIPGSVAALNVLVLLAVFGKSEPQTWAFYVLAAADVVAAIGVGVFWSAVASQITDIPTLALPVMAALLLKAGLTVLMAWKQAPRSGP